MSRKKKYKSFGKSYKLVMVGFLSSLHLWTSHMTGRQGYCIDRQKDIQIDRKIFRQTERYLDR